MIPMCIVFLWHFSRWNSGSAVTINFKIIILNKDIIHYSLLEHYTKKVSIISGCSKKNMGHGGCGLIKKKEVPSYYFRSYVPELPIFTNAGHTHLCESGTLLTSLKT